MAAMSESGRRHGRARRSAQILRVSALAVLGPLLAGCTGDAPSGTPSDVAVTDSAGVTIVDHGEVAYEELAVWRTADTPHLLIGVAEGEPAYELFDVLDAERLPDGSVAITDRSRMVRLFDPSGVQQWAVGGRGNGPGEFQWPTRVLHLPDDTLLVWDARRARMTRLARDGSAGRIVTVRALGGAASAVGLTDPTGLLVQDPYAERGAISNRGAVTHTLELHRVDLIGGAHAALATRFVGRDWEEEGNGAYSPSIFGARAVVAAAPEGFWFGEATRYELRRTTSEGLDRIVRWSGPDRDVSSGDVDAVLELWATEAGPDGDASIRAYGRTHPRADHFPAYEELLIGSDGSLYLADYHRQHEDRASRGWIVFAPDGASVRARLQHPARLRPLRIGAEWVLGVESDSLGVERIAEYAVVR